MLFSSSILTAKRNCSKMNMDGNNVVEYVETVLDNSQRDTTESCPELSEGDSAKIDTKSSNIEGTEKHSAVWTTDATLTLLKLYESKLELLETPKKKTRIWMAISENLREFNIDMSPDQVRWKINALAKKYKQCIDSGQHDKFKYFKEMDNIYAQYNVDCDSFTLQSIETQHKRKITRKNQLNAPLSESTIKSHTESKAMIELRKMRLANRIESDRSQSKINLEKQWLEYLKRQEFQQKLRDDINERTLKLREEELELKRKELEMKQSIELRKIEVREREQEEMLQIEREKCEMLKKIFAKQSNHFN